MQSPSWIAKMLGSLLSICTALLFLGSTLDWQALARQSAEPSCHSSSENSTADVQPLRTDDRHWPGSKSCDCDADCQCECSVAPSFRIGEIRRVAHPLILAKPSRTIWPALNCHSKDLHFQVLKVPIANAA